MILLPKARLPFGVRFSERIGLLPWVQVSLVLIDRKRPPLHILSREDSVAGMNEGLHCSLCSEKTALFVHHTLYLSFCTLGLP